MDENCSLQHVFVQTKQGFSVVSLYYWGNWKAGKKVDKKKKKKWFLKINIFSFTVGKKEKIFHKNTQLMPFCLENCEPFFHFVWPRAKEHISILQLVLYIKTICFCFFSKVTWVQCALLRSSKSIQLIGPDLYVAISSVIRPTLKNMHLISTAIFIQRQFEKTVMTFEGNFPYATS